MDLVICVAYKNCFFLKKNIPFINKNLTPEHIYVITKFSNFSLLEGIADNLKLLDENALIGGLSYAAVRKVLKSHLGINLVGWYFQQFLKMGFALTSFAKEEYLVWDADTIPLNHVDFKDVGGGKNISLCQRLSIMTPILVQSTSCLMRQRRLTIPLYLSI